VFCACSFPRVFIETPFMEMAHHVGVGTFEDLQQDRRPLDPTTHVDKLIIAYLPVDGGSAWNQLHRVPLRDMLVFADTFPGFYRDVSPMPPYSVPPPSSMPPPSSIPTAPMQGFWINSPPLAASTPQYSPASPDVYSPGGGMTIFPRYYSPASPGMCTFPPTPNAPPPCSTPNAPPRTSHPPPIPPFRLMARNDSSSEEEFICSNCRQSRGGHGFLTSYV